MTRRKRPGPIATGLVALAVLFVLAVAVPLSRGYSSLMGWFRDRVMTETDLPFDRDRLRTDLADAGFVMGDAVHIRIFKREQRLEVWMQKQNTAYRMFRAYDICFYSGGLGPKLREGDKQAPEGFYRIAYSQLNPASRHHLAFNLGFPNAFDSQLGRTGSFLMVHGGCSSIGCYAMTDASIDQIYAVVEAALDKGQPGVDVAIFPFRMTDDALEAEARNRWHPFWANLKRGSDLFEAQGKPPVVGACKGEYRFGDDADGPGCVPIRGWAA